MYICCVNDGNMMGIYQHNKTIGKLKKEKEQIKCSIIVKKLVGNFLKLLITKKITHSLHFLSSDTIFSFSLNFCSTEVHKNLNVTIIQR